MPTNQRWTAWVLASAGALGAGVAAYGTDGGVEQAVVVAADVSPDDGVRVATTFGDPLPGLAADELARFEAGKEEFSEAEEPDEGLGPVFNDVSCAACHSVPAVGGGSEVLETRFGTVTGGKFDPLSGRGGSLIQSQGIGVFPSYDGSGDCNYVAELVPPEATLVQGRRSTPLFGLGLVDAVPDESFHLLAGVQQLLSPSEAGRVAIVFDPTRNRLAVGRFGWKAQVASLFQFAGDAYLNEMGITSPFFPEESCPNGDCELAARCDPKPPTPEEPFDDAGEGVEAFRDFMTFLAPPPRGPAGATALRGQLAFGRAGCITCHSPTLVTGSSPISALDRVAFHPYSDFLLHDMGSLGDGIEVGNARGSEFRTAPLWGVRMITSFLHDGRARSVEEAILAHDGQGARARDAFQKLSRDDRQALVDFVESL